MMMVRMTMMYVDLHPVENVYRGPMYVKSGLRFRTKKRPETLQIGARCKDSESSSQPVDARIPDVFGCLSGYSPRPRINMAIEAHHQAAEHHQKAAEHHHKAAAHQEAGNQEKAHEHSSQAHEHATEAHKHSVDAHEKSTTHAGK
jgi:hypothetical protein